MSAKAPTINIVHVRQGATEAPTLSAKAPSMTSKAPTMSAKAPSMRAP